MDALGLIVIAVAVLAALLGLGYRGLRTGLNDQAAFGAVCLSLGTMLGCLLMVIVYAEYA